MEAKPSFSSASTVQDPGFEESTSVPERFNAPVDAAPVLPSFGRYAIGVLFEEGFFSERGIALDKVSVDLRRELRPRA